MRSEWRKRLGRQVNAEVRGESPEKEARIAAERSAPRAENGGRLFQLQQPV